MITPAVTLRQYATGYALLENGRRPRGNRPPKFRQVLPREAAEALARELRSWLWDNRPGYVPCSCRDCMEIAIATSWQGPCYCSACRAAGCPDYQETPGMPKECQVEPQLEDDQCLS